MPILTPAEVQAEVKRVAGAGLEAGARFLANRLKEVLSVPAPRRRVVSGPRSRNPGLIYYVATTKATPGAPPRKLSGRLRTSIAMDFDSAANVARVGTNVKPYPRWLEMETTHKWLLVTLGNNLTNLAAIIGQRFATMSNTAPAARGA